MKKYIEYYYNLLPNNVYKFGNIYKFILYETIFYFVPTTRPTKDLNELINIVNEVNQKELLMHQIILTKDNKPFIKYNELNYVLLKINVMESYEVSLTDIIVFNNNKKLIKEKNKLIILDWPTLWSNKIDYFEEQISSIGLNHDIILNSFSYYIGLAENAVSYANYYIENYEPSEYDRITLSHKRIYYPNYSLNFYNPLNIVLDLEIRDIAEYLKSSFFKGQQNLEEFTKLLDSCTLTSYSAGLLYSRLLYPSYYFDLYESIINNDSNEESLLNIIDMVNDYEYFLNDIYYIINKKTPIKSIDWILNKKL